MKANGLYGNLGAAGRVMPEFYPALAQYFVTRFAAEENKQVSGFTAEAHDRVGVARGVGKQKLDRDPLLELEVRRSDDDAHAALTENAVDAVLSGNHAADFDGGGSR